MWPGEGYGKLVKIEVVGIEDIRGGVMTRLLLKKVKCENERLHQSQSHSRSSLYFSLYLHPSPFFYLFLSPSVCLLIFFSLFFCPSFSNYLFLSISLSHLLKYPLLCRIPFAKEVSASKSEMGGIDDELQYVHIFMHVVYCLQSQIKF